MKIALLFLGITGMLSAQQIRFVDLWSQLPLDSVRVETPAGTFISDSTGTISFEKIKDSGIELTALHVGYFPKIFILKNAVRRRAIALQPLAFAQTLQIEAVRPGAGQIDIYGVAERFSCLPIKLSHPKI